VYGWGGLTIRPNKQSYPISVTLTRMLGFTKEFKEFWWLKARAAHPALKALEAFILSFPSNNLPLPLDRGRGGKGGPNNQMRSNFAFVRFVRGLVRKGRPNKQTFSCFGFKAIRVVHPSSAPTYFTMKGASSCDSLDGRPPNKHTVLTTHSWSLFFSINCSMDC